MVSTYLGGQTGLTFKFKLFEEVKKVRTNHLRGNLASEYLGRVGLYRTSWPIGLLSVLNFILPSEREFTDIRN